MTVDRNAAPFSARSAELRSCCALSARQPGAVDDLPQLRPTVYRPSSGKRTLPIDPSTCC